MWKSSGFFLRTTGIGAIFVYFGRLRRVEIDAFFGYFCPNLVAMATPLVPLKIQVVYLNSPTLYTLPYMRKIP